MKVATQPQQNNGMVRVDLGWDARFRTGILPRTKKGGDAIERLPPNTNQTFSLLKVSCMKVQAPGKKSDAARKEAMNERVCVDLAKSTFHVVGLDADRKTVFRRKFSREGLLS